MAGRGQLHRAFRSIHLRLIGMLLALGAMGCSLDIDVASHKSFTPLTPWQPPVGAPDSSFGDHGFLQPKITINADLSDSYFNVVEDPFGKLYMAGTIGTDFVVRSMNADGSANTIFGDQGVYREKIPFFRNGRALLGAQGIGTYLYVTTLSGLSSPGGTLRFMRMDLEGKVITSTEFEVPTVREVVDMVWAKDETIFIVLQDEAGIKITKINRDGNIVSGWGSAGSWIGDDADGAFNFGVYYRGLQEASDGTVYTLLDTSGGYRILYCMDNQGLLKTSFQGTGYLKITTPSLNAAGLAMDPSERVVIYGSKDSSGYAARYTAAGALDTTFNSPQGFVEIAEAGARVRFEHVVAEGDGTYQFYGYVDTADLSLKYNTNLLGQNKKAYARWSGSSTGVLSLATDLSQTVPLDPLNEVYGSYASGYYIYQPRIFRSTVSGNIYYLTNAWYEILPMDNVFAESHLFKLRNDGTLAWSTSKVFKDKLDFDLQLFADNIIPTRDESFYYIARLNMGRAGDATKIYHVKENGFFDSAYGSAGVVTIFNGSIRSGVVDIHGRLVVCGLIYDEMSSTRQFAMMRFLPSGMPDTSFGNQGTAVLNFSPDYWEEIDNPPSLILTSDGGIITSAISYDETLDETTTHLWKVNSSGQTQTSWGTTGLVVVPGPADLADYIEILKDNGEWLYLKANISEDTANAFNKYTVIARVKLSTGQLDGSFGNYDSYWKKIGLTPDAPLYVSGATAQAMDSQGRLYIVSDIESEDDSTSFHRIDRYTLDGNLDLNFKNGLGYLITGLEPDDYYEFTDLLIQKDDTLLLMERHAYETDNIYSFSLLKGLDSKGELIVEFGTNGTISSLDVSSGTQSTFEGISFSSSGGVILQVLDESEIKLLKLH